MKSLNTEKIFIDREKLYGLIDQKVTDSQVDEVLNRAMQLKGLDLKDAAVLLNIAVDDAVDFVDSIRQFELHLIRGTGGVDPPALEHHHADGELVAGIDTLVDHKAVQRGIL